MAKLSCGEWEIFAQAKGGGSILGLLDYQSASCGGVLDDISSASVTIGSAGLANDSCCRVLEQINFYEHELSFRRDGVEVWVGPVLDPVFGRDSAIIPARDLFHWFERRVLPYDRDLTEDLASIFDQFAQDALSLDTSPNITIAPFPTGVIGNRKVLANNVLRAADALRELAQTAVDFTARGRTIICGGQTVTTPAIAVLSAELLTGANISPIGSIQSTQVIVTGATQPDGTNLIAVAGSSPSVQTVYQEPSILDQPSLDHAAQSYFAHLSNPVYVQGGTLDPETPFDFSELVSGARVDVALDIGCRTLIGPQRLKSFTVNLTNDPSGFIETISPVLIPLGLT